MYFAIKAKGNFIPHIPYLAASPKFGKTQWKMPGQYT